MLVWKVARFTELGKSKSPEPYLGAKEELLPGFDQHILFIGWVAFDQKITTISPCIARGLSFAKGFQEYCISLTDWIARLWRGCDDGGVCSIT